MTIVMPLSHLVQIDQANQGVANQGAGNTTLGMSLFKLGLTNWYNGNWHGNVHRQSKCLRLFIILRLIYVIGTVSTVFRSAQ